MMKVRQVGSVQVAPDGRRVAAVDLLPALRQACPALSVIVLSGRPEAEDAALAAGADAFISKADPPEQLLAAIADCWRRRQAGPGDSRAVEL